MKQTIEIEVPEGKKAIWKDGKIVFQEIQSWKDIKDMSAVIRKLTNSKSCTATMILDELNRLTEDSHLWCVSAMKAIVWAITDGEVLSLTEGDIYYPIVQFCKVGCEQHCGGNELLGYIQSEGTKYTVVGSYAGHGSTAGLGSLTSGTVSYGWMNIGFQSVSSFDQAKHISKYFGKILFTAQHGGYNTNWNWID